MEEMVTNDDNERRVMPYNPELSYNMAILSVVACDQSHPQHCLDQYLPSAKFQLQTFVTKTCDFLDNKCSGYAAVSQALRALIVAFRGTKDTRQLIDDLLSAKFIARFSQWQSSGLHISRRPLRIYGSTWSRK